MTTAADILIVDDHLSLQMLLTLIVEGAGYRGATANNGQDALTYLRSSTNLPRLILLDVAMPIMTGWDFLRAQQQDARLATIPVVLMTALSGFDHEEAAANVVAYLKKPIDLDALEALVHAQYQPQLKAKAVGI
jgi:CheY-like chemotaxis protein